VIAWSGDVPALYPGELSLRPWVLHLREGTLWLARAAATERLQAVSVGTVGSLYGFALSAAIAFMFGTAGTYPIARKFVTTGLLQPVSLEDALTRGESDVVEFKEQVKERQQLLKDITAFANTRGGTVFIGIVDGTAEVVGIDALTPERRDAFERGLRDSIRNSIQPSPDVMIDYPIRGTRTVARIFVPAGRDLHSFEGRYYKREGSQSRYLEDGEIGRL